MKLEGLGRIEELDTDDQNRPRRMVVNAIVSGTPITIILRPVDPGHCFEEAKEQDENLEVVVAQ